MNQYHQEILGEINKVAKLNRQESGHFNVGKYMGTSKPIINITNPQTREIVKNWLKAHKNLSLQELVDMLDSLFRGESHTERSLGGKILEYLPRLRAQIEPQCLDTWLEGAEGWGEVDSLCQSSFTASELLDNRHEWEKLLKKFVEDKDVHKRRAALVLLVKPVRESDDQRLTDLAFENLDKLKKEKDVLITKAVSWLLRSLIEKHKDEVVNYLQKNQESLPKIAVREVSRKLLTGKK